MLWVGLHLRALPPESIRAELGATPEAALGLLLDTNPTLQSVAHAALAFTPAVSFEGVDTVTPCIVLDVQSSLRYFGGLQPLLKRLRGSLDPLGHIVQMATAPTALAAAWLARWRDDLEQGPHSTNPAALQALLDTAPVTLIEADPPQGAALRSMGLATLGHLRHLPRPGVTRRFDESLLHRLDRAYGLRADPRVWLTLPEHFDSRVELFSRADTGSELLQGAAVLLARLMVWLQAQNARASRITLLMHHEPRRHRRSVDFEHPDELPGYTCLEVGLAEPSCDATHLKLLLRERLALLQLPAPTLDLQLQCSDFVRAGPPNTELFATPRSEHEGLTCLIERLQARLGCEQVLRIERVQDYRPERASVLRLLDRLPLARQGRAQTQRPEKATDELCVTNEPSLLGSLWLHRPAWLLSEPVPLPQRQAVPWFEGHPLQLLCSLERIETGWWDDDAMAARDYYIAQAADGALLWVYCSRMPDTMPTHEQLRSWALQGRFG